MKKFFIILIISIFFILFSNITYAINNNYRKIDYIPNLMPHNSYLDNNMNYVSEFIKKEFDNIKNIYSNDECYYWCISFFDNDINYTIKIDDSYYKFEDITKDNKKFVKITLDTNKLIDIAIKNYKIWDSFSFSSVLDWFWGRWIINDNELINLYKLKDYYKYSNISKDYSINSKYNLLLSKVEKNNIYINNFVWDHKWVLELKYNNYIKDKFQNIYILNLIKDKNIINKFIKDLFIVNLFINKSNNNKSWFYLDTSNNYYIIWEKKEWYKSISNLDLFLDNWKHIWCSPNSENNSKIILCTIDSNFDKQYQINLKDISFEDKNNLYINISKLFNILYKSNLNISNIDSLNVMLHYSLFKNWNENNYAENLFSYQKKDISEKLILSFVKNIATPKTISKDISVISLNGLLALLYILMFYFTWALFNNNFQDEKWNNSNLNNILKKYWQKFWSKIYDFTKLIFGFFLRNNKILIFLKKVEKYISHHSHKVNIILWFICLWIISQIIVWELDISSVNSVIVLFIFILVVWIFSLIKDLILYLTLKKQEKENIKIDIIPSWFLLLSIVAVFVNIFKIVPWVLFWTTNRLNTLTTITRRKTNNAKKLLFILLFIYIIWVCFWFSSLFFLEDSILYKLVLTNYFAISNDVFFTLLPFSIFWGSIILREKRYLKYWIVFLFISFFTLLHTILNPKWDFKKVISLEENNLNIFILVLFIWIITTIIFWYFLIYKKNKKL